MKNWFNEFNCGRRSLKDKIREGRQKAAVVPENIDAVHELIMQNRQVTYRGIFIKTDHVATVLLEQRCMANAEWYTTISLKKFE